MEKISVIVPVYNVEPYVAKCLDSVLKQTYRNLEILVVDDGSTDHSGNICDEYAKNDTRVKVYHKQNGGLSSALNVGLKNFTGDFLGIVDSDDFIEPEMFSRLHHAIKNADIAVCAYFRDTVSFSEEMHNRKNINEPVISTKNMLLYPLKRDFYMGFCGYLCNKLFRAETIKKSGLLLDEDIKYAMDVLFYTQLVLDTHAVGTYIDIPLYHYLQRDGAITKSESFDIKTDILKVYKRVEMLLNQNGYTDISYWARGFYCHHAKVIAELARKKRDEEMLIKMQREIKEHYADYKRTNRAFPEKFKAMKDLLNCKLVNVCDYRIGHFADQIENKSITCFGALTTYEVWCRQNREIVEKIKAVVDNNKSLNGAVSTVGKRKISVVSLKKFIKMGLDNFVFLITSNRYADDIIRQLDLSGEFGGVDCYTASLISYKDNGVLRKLQLAELEILDEFVRVCNQHHLTYYLCGGTLLGAVRHKGFIPWDDDIDVWMPRDDFDKFVSLPPQAFKEDFFLHWATTDASYDYIFARLRKRNTLFDVHKCHCSDTNSNHNTISIDVFQADFLKKKNSRLSFHRNRLLRKIERMIWFKSGFCSVGRWTPMSALPLHILVKIGDRVKKWGSARNTGYYQNQPIEVIFGKGTPLEFEGRLLNAPSDWNFFLTWQYGENYRQMPPVTKRHAHSPLRLSFNLKEGNYEDV